MEYERAIFKAISRTFVVVRIVFSECRFIHLPRSRNQMADALASLITMPMKPLVLLKLSQSCYKSIKIMEARVDQKPWFYDIQ